MEKNELETKVKEFYKCDIKKAKHIIKMYIYSNELDELEEIINS